MPKVFFPTDQELWLRSHGISQIVQYEVVGHAHKGQVVLISWHMVSEESRWSTGKHYNLSDVQSKSYGIHTCCPLNVLYCILCELHIVKKSQDFSKCHLDVLSIAFHVESVKLVPFFLPSLCKTCVWKPHNAIINILSI